MRFVLPIVLVAACGGGGAGGDDDVGDGDPFEADDTCAAVLELEGAVAASIAPPAYPACLTSVSFGAGVDFEQVFLGGPVARIAVRADDVVLGAPSQGGVAEVTITDPGDLAWRAEGCVIDVVASDFYAEDDFADLYRTWGEVRCGAPAAPVDHGADDVVVVDFVFLATIGWQP